METRAKLSEIIRGMEFHSDEKTHFLDTSTGKLVAVTLDAMFADEEDDSVDSYPEWQRESVEAAKSLAKGNDGSLIELPAEWDVNEYKIMEDFCMSLPAGESRSELYRSMQGRGAFRRFKETVKQLKLTDDWNRYRTSRFKTVAMEWCDANDILYEDDLAG